MSAHPAPRATRSIKAETAGSSGLALGPNQRGKGGGEVEASVPVMAMAHQRTRPRLVFATADQKCPFGCGEVPMNEVPFASMILQHCSYGRPNLQHE